MEEEEKSKSLAKLKNKHEAMITDLEGKWGAQGLLDLGLLGHPPLEDQMGLAARSWGGKQVSRGLWHPATALQT